jgi:hypothetical protein
VRGRAASTAKPRRCDTEDPEGRDTPVLPDEASAVVPRGLRQSRPVGPPPRRDTSSAMRDEAGGGRPAPVHRAGCHRQFKPRSRRARLFRSPSAAACVRGRLLVSEKYSTVYPPCHPPRTTSSWAAPGNARRPTKSPMAPSKTPTMSPNPPEPAVGPI